jgi:mRNA deadenylase 3'-5' endonuclease subunit Ccr4
LDDKQKDLISNETAEELMHTLQLFAFTNVPFTHCCSTFECVIDYVFFENEIFNLKKVLPFPPVDELKKNVALPSEFVPSDHIPVIIELEFNNNQHSQSN